MKVLIDEKKRSQELMRQLVEYSKLNRKLKADINIEKRKKEMPQ